MTTNSDTAHVIRARGLGRTFRSGKRTVEAVADLDLDVRRGELVAFLGPNGAGKSTSLRMLTTLLPPTTGTATVVGCDVRTDPAGVRSRIGYIGQGSSGGHNQRVRDELLSQGAFYGMRRAETARRADELLESLDLAPLATRGIMALSGGQKRRLDIALGLLHEPELLFLDEPSTGLDPQSRANLWQHIARLREERGTTVFVTTHYLEEADRYAERVMVMDRGRMIADDTAASLKSTLAGDVVRVGFAGADAAAAALPHVARVLGVEPERSGDVLEATVADGDRALPVLLRELDAAGAPADRASSRPPTLDDVFLALTGRSLRDAGDGANAGEGDEPADGASTTSSTTTSTTTSTPGTTDRQEAAA